MVFDRRHDGRSCAHSSREAPPARGRTFGRRFTVLAQGFFCCAVAPVWGVAARARRVYGLPRGCGRLPCFHFAREGRALWGASRGRGRGLS